MFTKGLAGAALALFLAASVVEAQTDTGYYGGGDYRRIYAYGRDYPFGWWGYPGPSFGYSFGGPVRERIIYYPAPPADDAPKAAPVTIDVKLPAEADLWIEGIKMKQSGELRTFISPKVEPGQRFVYDFRIRFTENGREITKTRTLIIYAGQHITVDFVNPPKTPVRQQEFSSPKKPKVTEGE
jgi:uncharacterized protein (TIGR03000 family)